MCVIVLTCWRKLPAWHVLITASWRGCFWQINWLSLQNDRYLLSQRRGQITPISQLVDNYAGWWDCVACAFKCFLFFFLLHECCNQHFRLLTSWADLSICGSFHAVQLSGFFSPATVISHSLTNELVRFYICLQMEKKHQHQHQQTPWSNNWELI